MARNYILPKDGNFYKANLHCHSTCSDGKFTPEHLKEIYKERGYSILAYSDHNAVIPHNDLRDEDFLPITAAEYNFDEELSPEKPIWGKIKTYHINFYSKDPNRTDFIDFERTHSVENIQKVINDANAAGFLVQYNHPRWSYQTVNDFIDLEGLFAFEVLNYGCETEMHNGWAEYEYDCYCRNGKRAAAVATDDNHSFAEDINGPYNDCFGGWTMIKAPALEYDAVMGALERKECYATNGPTIEEFYIDAYEDKDVLHIKCSPVMSLLVLTDSRLVSLKRELGDTVVDHVVEFPKGSNFYRLECMQKDGKKAVSRAVFADELDRS